MREDEVQGARCEGKLARDEIGEQGRGAQGKAEQVSMGLESRVV